MRIKINLLYVVDCDNDNVPNEKETITILENENWLSNLKCVGYVKRETYWEVFLQNEKCNDAWVMEKIKQMTKNLPIN